MRIIMRLYETKSHEIPWPSLTRLPVEIMLSHPNCICTTINPTNNPTACVDEIRSLTFNKDLDMMGTSKRKQKARHHHMQFRIQKVDHFYQHQYPPCCLHPYQSSSWIRGPPNDASLSTFPSSSMDGSVFAGTASSFSRTSCALPDHHSDVHVVKTKFLPSGSKLVLMVLKLQEWQGICEQCLQHRDT